MLNEFPCPTQGLLIGLFNTFELDILDSPACQHPAICGLTSEATSLLNVQQDKNYLDKWHQDWENLITKNS
jgi:hypothetical protein